MQVFELHFNPRAKKETLFETFYYEPENFYENRLGSLFLAGELKNANPDDDRFLKNLARVLKTKFYDQKIISPEKSLKKTLKEANAFLDGIIKNGEVNWISNLDFAILTLTPTNLPNSQKLTNENIKYRLNFTKVGNMEILLARDGEILNLGEKLNLEEIEPYPLKVFTNIVNGKLEENDKILILSHNIYSLFTDEGIAKRIARLALVSQNGLNEALKNLEKDASGICLLIDLGGSRKKEENQKMVFKEKILEKNLNYLRGKTSLARTKISAFSHKLSLLFSSLGTKAKNLKTKIEKTPRIKAAKPEEKKKKISLPIKMPEMLTRLLISVKSLRFSFKVPSGNLSDFSRLSDLRKKAMVIFNQTVDFLKGSRLAIILIFASLLLLGSFIAKLEGEKGVKKIENQFSIVKEKIAAAEDFLSRGKTDRANDLFLEAWQEIQPILKINGQLGEEIKNSEENIQKNLFALNKLEQISPQSIFEFKQEENLPQKIILYQDSLYCFSPYTQGLVKIKLDGASSEIDKESVLTSVVVFYDKLLFFIKPNQLSFLVNDNLENPFVFKLPSENSDLKYFASFFPNLYFWNKESGQIAKYKYLGKDKWSAPESWLKKKTEGEVKSMSVDGDIWLLKQDGTIEHYLSGQLLNILSLKTFPFLKNPTKIIAPVGLPYLYILDQEEKRVIIVNKTNGNILKQYQSEEFDNLKDFTVSSSGQTIYLLNGLKIYKIEIRL